MNFINWKYSTNPSWLNADTLADGSSAIPGIDTVNQAPTDCLLIPITLNFDISHSLKIRDSFLYNYYELDNVVSFSTKLIQDWDFVDRQEYLDQVVETIRNTCELYKYATRSDSVANDMKNGKNAVTENDKLQNTGDIKVSVEDSLPLYTSYKIPKNDSLDEREDANGNTIPINNAHQAEAKDKDESTEKQIEGENEVADQSVDDNRPLFPNGVRSVKFEQAKGAKISYEDIRIVIKLDVHVGSLYLRDQFEWELFGDEGDVEIFAKGLCADLGISGEFQPLISTSIRTQIIQGRLDYQSSTPAIDFDRPLRDEDETEDWEPDVRFLDEEEIQLLAREEERSSRRMRRARPNTTDITDLPRLEPVDNISLHAPLIVKMDVDLTDTSMKSYKRMQDEVIENRAVKKGCKYQKWTCDWCMIPGEMTQFIRVAGEFELCDNCGKEFVKNGEVNTGVREFRNLLGEVDEASEEGSVVGQ